MHVILNTAKSVNGGDIYKILVVTIDTDDNC